MRRGINQSEISESEQSEVEKDAAINKMKKLATKIYDTTPGIAECKLFFCMQKLLKFLNHTDWLAIFCRISQEAV